MLRFKKQKQKLNPYCDLATIPAFDGICLKLQLNLS